MNWFSRNTEVRQLDRQKKQAFADLEKRYREEVAKGHPQTDSLTKLKEIWLAMRGSDLSTKSMVDYAIQDFKEAMELEPEDLAIRTTLSLCCRVNGRATEAAAIMSKTPPATIEKADKLMQAYFYQEMGNAYMLCGYLAEGLEYMRKALHIAQDNSGEIEAMITAGLPSTYNLGSKPDLQALLAELHADITDLEATARQNEQLTAPPA